MPIKARRIGTNNIRLVGKTKPMLYEPVIGLEIHAELLTKSKMFCGCAVVDSTNAESNLYTCPICTGQPGALPQINEQAIELAIRVGLALNCTIQYESIFARKNYFYPDLPKGYQISQYEFPIASNGWVDIDTTEGRKRIRVRRVHIEEDTGKLTHIENKSLIDYNRSGVPLLEIVTEPDLHSAKDAVTFATKLRSILRYLGANTGNMEKGVIRFEANVSVRVENSDALNTRTEIKNLNSFRSLAEGIEYEIRRQSQVYAAGEIVKQETLGFNEATGKTYSQRDKENANDYRYFPEPDLPPLVIDSKWVLSIKNSIPELSDAKRERYIRLGLSVKDADILIDEMAVTDYFDQAVKIGLSNNVDAKSISNWITSELFSKLGFKSEIASCYVTPQKLVELIAMVDSGVISNTIGRTVLDEMVTNGKEAKVIVKEKGLLQISDLKLINTTIEKIIANNPDKLKKFLSGKETIKEWFFGQVMREMDGKANPSIVKSVLENKLGEEKSRLSQF
jgi:aspartyl-tRNA(Asn)/glutamyl-tRNA(Gln) amidotransferase subunit B